VIQKFCFGRPQKGASQVSTDLAAEAATGWGPAPPASIQILFRVDRYSIENIYGFQEKLASF